MSEEDVGKREVFREHLKECLEHLSKRIAAIAPYRTVAATRARAPMVEFTGTSQNTVLDWLSGEYLPRGTAYLKLLCFMDINGYKVIELERTERVHRQILELIGYGVLTGEQVRGLLGYAQLARVFEILRTGSNTSKEKEQVMWDIWKERRALLRQRKEEAGKKFILCLDAPQPIQVESAAADVLPAQLSNTMTAAVDIMEGLLKLLDRIDLSAAEVRILHERASGTVLRLSSYFSALSAKIVNLTKEVANERGDLQGNR